MALNVSALRALVALDEEDALSHFALGQKLFAEGTVPEDLTEAILHLTMANQADPDHLATYHVLAQALIRQGVTDEARKVLEMGIRKTEGVPAGMGGDLRPVLEDLLASL